MQTSRSRWRSCRDVKGEMDWLSQKISQVSEAGLKILYIDSSNSGNKQLKNMSTCVCVCTVIMIAVGAINVSYLSPIRRRKWKRGDVHSIYVLFKIYVQMISEFCVCVFHFSSPNFKHKTRRPCSLQPHPGLKRSTAQDFQNFSFCHATTWG